MNGRTILRTAGLGLGALLPALSFLFRDGYFASSDGMIHLYRLFELDRSWHAGVLFPRWFPLSGYGYGLPVLNFYPAATYWLAELFHLAGAGYIVAIKLTIAVGLIGAAISMFVFARDLLGARAAFVAGIAYAYAPYLLSDAFVRGNFPELLTIAQIPFALWAFRRVEERADAPARVLIAAGAFAAIILTHQLTAMQFAGLLLAYLGFLFALRRNVKNLLTCGAAIALGLALSAFYWVPSLAELNFVYVGPESLARFLVSRLVTLGEFFAPALAYTYLPQSEALKHAFGFPQTMLTLLAGAGALVHAVRSAFRVSRLTAHVLFFALIVILSIFMTLTFSAPLWYAIPTLRFMQFPWRFQILASVGTAFLLGVWARWLANVLPRAKPILAPLWTLALIVLALANLPLRDFPLTDAQVNLTRVSDPDYVIAQMGWGWTREFVPAAVQDADAIYKPVAKSQGVGADGVPTPVMVVFEQADELARKFRIVAAQPFELSLHTFFFPGWQAVVDDAPARTYPRGALGLATVAVPSGEHRVTFRFEETPLRAAMDGVSLIAFAGVGVWLWRAQRRAFGVTLAALIVFVGLCAWHTHTPRASVVPAAGVLDQRVQLIGYSAERERDAIYVTLYWLALRDIERDYFAFVHLLDTNGAVSAQHDGPPDQGLTPTTRWLPGEIIVDRHAVALEDAAPGKYRLAAGMYLPLASGFQNLGERIELGVIRIER